MDKLVNHIGSWSFLVGVILAIALGFREITYTISVFLIVLGLIIGFINVTDKDIQSFLYAGAIIVIVSSLGMSSMDSVAWMKGILHAITLIFIPATIIVALKSVFHISHK